MTMFRSREIYEFGPFRVDARERQLLRNRKVLALTPKVFDILLLLIQNNGHILIVVPIRVGRRLKIGKRQKTQAV